MGVTDGIEFLRVTKPGPVAAVIGALASEQYDYQSPESIAHSAGLPSEEVGRILVEHSDLVRKPLIPIEGGRPLFTLANRRPGWRERYAIIRSFLTKTLP